MDFGGQAQVAKRLGDLFHLADPASGLGRHDGELALDGAQAIALAQPQFRDQRVVESQGVAVTSDSTAMAVMPLVSDA